MHNNVICQQWDSGALCLLFVIMQFLAFSWFVVDIHNVDFIGVYNVLDGISRYCLSYIPYARSVNGCVCVCVCVGYEVCFEYQCNICYC